MAATPNTKIVKVMTVIVSIVFLIMLFVIKANSEDFPVGRVIIIGGAIILVGTIIFFTVGSISTANIFSSKNKNVNILPDPANMTVLIEKAHEAITNNVYMDHIIEFKDTINWTVGKNPNKKPIVVEFKVIPLYDQEHICSILINANYTNRMPTVIYNSDDKKRDLNKAIQSMSFDPADPANLEETVVHNELTGTTATTKKKTYNKNSAIKNDKKEDLV